MKWFAYLFLALGVLSCADAGAADGPAAALAGVQKAIDTNDQAMFEKYVDVRGIIAGGVDRFVADYAAHPPGGEGDPMLEMLAGGLARESGLPADPAMKLMLVEEARRFVVRGIASGDFSGHPSNRQDLPEGGLLSALFADVSSGRKELRDVRVQPPRGDRTTATARMFDHGTGRSYPVRMGLGLQPAGYWKVTDITNMTELIRLVRNEAGAR